MYRALTRTALLACALLAFPACDSNDDDDDGGGGGSGAAFLGCSSVGTIDVGQTRTGSVRASDCDEPSRDEPTDYYRFSLASSRTVTISMTSDAFDTYLVLYSASGTVVTGDDDGGENTNSLITRELDAGSYVIAASTFGTFFGTETAFGDYALTLR